jgi:penicillin amidase
MKTNGFKTWGLRLLGGIVALVLLALFAVWVFLRSSLAQLDGRIHAPGLHGDVIVTRDAQGVPTISGQNREDLAYATGYLHGQDRYFQMDLTRRAAAGELSELFGPRALPLDRQRRLHRFRARAAGILATMPANERAFLDRYAAGINDGLDALGARPFEYALIGVKPRRWEAADSLLVVWAMFLDLQGNLEPRELARGWFRDHTSAAQLAFLLPESTEWDAPLDAAAAAPGGEAIPAEAPSWWGRRNAQESKVASSDYIDGVGSNNWAVSGKRTQIGSAIVSDDMHLGLRLPNTWYRVVLQYPDPKVGTRRVVGVSLPGAAPLVVVGSNGQVAWGFTNSYGDYLDLVALGTDAGHPGQLQTPSGWETPSSVEETIAVKGQAPEKLVVRSVALGPVREAGGRNYAVHWTAHLPGSVNLAPLKVETASTVAEVLAIASTAGIPAQNYVAGDSLGNIGWTVGGLMPRRAHPGVAATFPLGEGASAGWDGVLTPEEHPKIINPAGGQIVTANSRQLMGQGAELIGDGGFDLGARTRQARDDLAAIGGKVGVKEAYAVTLDDRALFMTQWRERAIKALDARAIDKQPLRAEFLQHLKTGWTGRASVDSVGYQLTRNYMWALYDVLYGGANAQIAMVDERASTAMATTRWPVVVGRLIDTEAAGWLPPDYKDWQQLQLVAIDKVIAYTIREQGKLSAATWGARNTAAIEHPIAPAVPSFLHRFLAAPADMLPGDANMPRVAGRNQGQSERMTVMPGKEEEGIFNMPGGQSGHPMSPFFLNGHADWVSGKATPLLPGAPRHQLVFSAKE